MVAIAGWIQRDQQAAIVYLLEENRSSKLGFAGRGFISTIHSGIVARGLVHQNPCHASLRVTQPRHRLGVTHQAAFETNEQCRELPHYQRLGVEPDQAALSAPRVSMPLRKSQSRSRRV